MADLLLASLIHWIDNTAALAGIAKGYSSKLDSARIIHAFHSLGVVLQAEVYFEYVASEANVADLPSRGDFDFLAWTPHSKQPK